MAVNNLVGHPDTSGGAPSLQELRRRDNLEDFVDGLVWTEIFPYPNGQHDVVPSIRVPLQEVVLKPDAYDKLTTLNLPRTSVQLDGKKETMDLAVILTPNLGVGTFELWYEDVLEENANLELLPDEAAERLRMALWSRFEWVHEKIDYINELRREAAARASDKPNGAEDLDQEVDMDVDADLEEEADPYDTQDVTLPSSPRSDGTDELQLQFQGDTCFEAQDSDFPDTQVLSELDVNTLKALFDVKSLKQLKDIHSEFQANKVDTEPSHVTDSQHGDLHGATSNDISDNGSEDRSITLTEDDIKPMSKTRRIELNNEIAANFRSVAQVLPTSDSDDQQIQACRQAAGNLHLVTRILELENNLGRPKDKEVEW